MAPRYLWMAMCRTTRLFVTIVIKNYILSAPILFFLGWSLKLCTKWYIILYVLSSSIAHDRLKLPIKNLNKFNMMVIPWAAVYLPTRNYIYHIEPWFSSRNFITISHSWWASRVRTPRLNLGHQKSYCTATRMHLQAKNKRPKVLPAN